MRRPTPVSTATSCFLGLALFLLVGAASAAGDEHDYGYGFYRTVEGTAVVAGLEEEADPVEVEANYPVLTGDRLWVEEGSRIEAVLPDRTVVRLAQSSEVYFESLAGSADSPEDAGTVLHLLSGTIQIVSDAALLSHEAIVVVTDNSRVYLESPGSYRLTSDGRGWTEATVREGFAEINTERGSSIARRGEAAIVEGTYRPVVTMTGAGALAELEYWGAELSGERIADHGYVDDSLAYAAAPLDRSGEWVVASGRTAWQPRVRAGWRPFTDGWWAYTPSGLSWVAYEPWGWVTSHYGAWDYVPGYGWLWFPGTTYSPAWVYWYWGPTHTAWIPSGYYTRYYGAGFDFGFRFGVYGWAGGTWDRWGFWTFCPTRYFGRRDYRSYWRSGRDMHRDRRLHAVPRGVITTDTRDIHPRRWGKPTEIVQALERRHVRDTRSARQLGDVTPFIERRSSLPGDVARVVRARTDDTDARMGGSASESPRARSVGATARSRRSGEEPWRVARPDSLSGGADRQARPLSGRRGADGSGTDWELIERLRRFENKQEGRPASPTPGRSGSSSTLQGESPSRQILDCVRSRDPRSLPRRYVPTDPATSPRRSTPERTAPPSARPSTGSRTAPGNVSPRRPTSRPSSGSVNRQSSPQRKPSSGSVSRPSSSQRPSATSKSSGASRSRSSARKKD